MFEKGVETFAYPIDMIVLSIPYTLLRYFVLIQSWLFGKGSAAKYSKEIFE